MVAAKPLMSGPGSRARFAVWTRSTGWPLLVLLGALTLTGLAGLLAMRVHVAQADALVSEAIKENLGRLRVRIGAYVALLHASRAFALAREEQLDRRSFEAFVGGLDLPGQYRGIQGIGWSPRVDPSRIDAFEDAARRQGYKGFAVHPPGPREPMFSILHLEPLDERNRAALGFDMSSEPVRAAAMRRAQDSGRLAVSGRVVLLQEIDADKRAGFLVYLPLYDGGVIPEDLGERRQRLTGFIYAPFRAHVLFDEVFQSGGPAFVQAVYAGTEPQEQHLLAGRHKADGEPALRRVVEFGGLPWTVQFGRVAPPFPWGAVAVLLAGSLLSGVLFLLAHAQWRGRRQVEERQALLDLVIQGSGEGIIVADEQGVLRIFNPAAERQHGAGLQQVSAPGWADAYGLHTLDGQRLPLEQTPLYRAVHGETVTNAIWKIRRPDGSWRILAGTATPLRRPDGRSAGAVLTVRDETEQMREKAQRERLMAALERSNRELDQFAYAASHDLKAPLRGIGNLAHWIEEDFGSQVPAAVRQHCQLIHGRVHRMEALIDGLLAYSRAGRIIARPDEVDTAALLHEIVDLLAPQPSQVVSIEAPMPLLRTDRVALQQVFMNLVGNSLKHARTPGSHVTVRCREAGEFWEFAVSDNGPGIAARYHERIWGMFQTLEARDKVEGTGIGLAIVSKTVQARGGRAWVESAEGEGATFLFTWPRVENIEDDE